jgi:hypothetical protein
MPASSAADHHDLAPQQASAVVLQICTVIDAGLCSSKNHCLQSGGVYCRCVQALWFALLWITTSSWTAGAAPVHVTEAMLGAAKTHETDLLPGWQCYTCCVCVQWHMVADSVFVQAFMELHVWTPSTGSLHQLIYMCRGHCCSVQHQSSWGAVGMVGHAWAPQGQGLADRGCSQGCKLRWVTKMDVVTESTCMLCTLYDACR